MVEVRIRAATLADAAAVARIYNAGIAGHAATFETSPRSAEDLEHRLAETERYPMVVADAGASDVVGWASVGEYRPRACYTGIAEFSVYVAPDWHGRGVGRQLLEALIVAATDRGFWKLVSRVFTFNAASRALCRALGFREVGIYERHGYLDGAWRDVVIVERLIPENQSPAGLRFRRAKQADWPAIAQLLEQAALPIAGAREHLAEFVVAVDQDRIIGSAGLERYGDAALLRSVALTPSARGGGEGRRLVERVLGHAAREGINDVVLRTTTAEAFFARLGFAPIALADVPAAIKQSSEFTGVCPETAVTMRRRLP